MAGRADPDNPNDARFVGSPEDFIVRDDVAFGAAECHWNAEGAEDAEEVRPDGGGLARLRGRCYDTAMLLRWDSIRAWGLDYAPVRFGF